jgi:menaquinone-9 beta-reductase
MSGADSADVTIVGGGPAGAVTALLLARAGHDVLLLDRARFPRPKPCGDCLSAGATAVLERLGVLERVHALPHAQLRRWRIVAPDGDSFTARIADPPGHALAIEREHLDHALLEAARAEGVRIREGRRVHDICRSSSGVVNGVLTSDGPVHARLIVGADGLRSVIARRLDAIRRPPRLRKLSLTLHVDAAADDPGTGEMHVGHGVCAGLAAVGRDRCNITVVAHARLRRSVAADPRAFIASVLTALPRLRRRVPAAALQQAELLTSGPFDQPMRRITFDGAALAGDAAGYYDPFTGQGVCHALLGAEILARVADDALRAGDCSAQALTPYAAALHRLLRAPGLLQRGVEAVLSRPGAANRVIARLGHSHVAADTLIAVIGHARPAAALFSAGTIRDLARPAVPQQEDQ